MERVASSCASLLAQRRGYSVAAAAVVKGTSGRKAVEKVAKRMMGKEANYTAAAAAASASASAEKTPWVPDPVTGYYRPATAGGANKEVDAAELRAKLLTRRVAN